MEPTFSYAILKAIPDARRGERVNVGIVVLGRDRIDVRLSDVSKVRAISTGNWEQYATDFRDRLVASFSVGVDPKDLLSRASLLEDVIRFSELSWFSVKKPEQYEDRIKEILSALVVRPRADT